MIKGIYTSASALRAAMIQQGRLAHNMANAHTTGFKQVLTTKEAYPARSLSEVNEHHEVRNPLMGALENGLLVPEEVTDFSQGALQQTDRPLDLAIQGDGFFRVQTPEGERYTRDGSFHRDALQSRLSTADGHFVLDVDGQPLVVPPGDLAVMSNGALFVDNQPVGQIGLAAFADLAGITLENGNLYRGEGAQPLPPLEANIQQGYLEGSNVDETVQIVEMMRILRMYEASQRMLQVQDRAITQAISVGEV